MQYVKYLVDTSDSLGAVPGPVIEEPAWDGEPRSAIHSWTREAKPLILNPFKNSHLPWNLKPRRPRRTRLSANLDFPDFPDLSRLATIYFVFSRASTARDYCTLKQLPILRVTTNPRILRILYLSLSGSVCRPLYLAGWKFKSVAELSSKESWL